MEPKRPRGRPRKEDAWKYPPRPPVKHRDISAEEIELKYHAALLYARWAMHAEGFACVSGWPYGGIYAPGDD